MGHIDHGKSTLLDYIRKTNITDKEAGGITQHISAYEVECVVSNQKRNITFIDTPGHEAFLSARENGSRVADIAILIVSADDSVKPQTIEALNCIKKENLPFIVAISKIDKNGANIEKVKQDLAEKEVFVEGWGGTVPCVPISSKTGSGIEELIDMIILQSDLEEFEGDTKKNATGFVIESDMNPKQGIRATLIIKDGSMKTGMFIATKNAYAPIRSIENYCGQNINEASFSMPIRIVGWNNIPKVGSTFLTMGSKEEALQYISKNQEIEVDTNNPEIKGVPYHVVIKADTVGSIEAIWHELQKLNNDKIHIKIVNKGIGNVTEGDIKTANIKKSIVISFNTSIDKNAESLALREHIEIKKYKIIYELVDYIREKMKEATPTEMVETVIGEAKILKVFSINKDKQVIGARVQKG